MPQMSAFIARSFDPRDESRIQPLLEHLQTFEKVGFFCETAEAAEVESVSKKVRRMIDEREVFIGFLTRRLPISTHESRFGAACRALIGAPKPRAWTAPPWVLQESGYALRGERKIILLKEIDVEISGLQGDLEYVPFDSRDLSTAISKLNDMVLGLLADASGTTVRLVVEQRSQVPQVATETTAAKPDQQIASDTVEAPDIGDAFGEMVDAANRRDLEGIDNAWKAGTSIIAGGKHTVIDQLAWDCVYFDERFRGGATDALNELKKLKLQNPARYEPIRALASSYYGTGEFDLAAQFYLEAANLQNGERKGRSLLMASKALKETKKYREADDIVDSALTLVPESLRDEAISLHYELLKLQGRDYFAFARAEAALHENPVLPIRFTLGLDYRAKNLHEIALHHFKFLCDHNSENAASLHNLALLFADCKMPIKAVEHYRRAIALGETLSAANLGSMYLDCGLADEATSLMKEAMKQENYDDFLDRRLAEVAQRRAGERDAETTVLKEANEKRAFLMETGDAMKAPLPPIEGRWRFPFGEMPLSVNDGKVYGSANIKKQRTGLALLLTGVGGSSAPAEEVESYAFFGTLTGAVCEFQLIVGPATESGAVGLVLSTLPSKFGLITFSAEGSSAKYAELKDSKLTTVETIAKIRPSLAISPLPT